jgi:hypothetical protein
VISPGLAPSPGKKALQVGADHVRQFFGYFEFHYRVAGAHLKNSDQWLRRFSCNGYVSYLVHVAHQWPLQVLKLEHTTESKILFVVSGQSMKECQTCSGPFRS